MNVEDLLTEKNIYFLAKGKDYVIRCLNPEHDDSNPSMRVHRIDGRFHCFSCGYRGNIFTHFGEKPDQLQLRREKLKTLLKQKMAERMGLVLPKNIEPYEGEWRNIKSSTYKKFEAFLHADKDFISRINFPIRDITGKIVAFNGRHTSTGIPKYLISPPGAKMPLFPMNAKPINSSLVLVEGIFDMLNLYDKNITNAVCCFGVSNVTVEKLALFKISGVNHIDIFFDSDAAGQNGAKKVQELCESTGLSARILTLKNTDKDPGALTETQVQKLRRQLYA